MTEQGELHAHHLRHSFATQHVLGALVPDLPEGHSEALPQWLKQYGSEASSQRFHKLCRARFGGIAKRGTMVSMAMGHGADETTYEHYVHGLDVLVHAVLANPSRHYQMRKRGNTESIAAASAFSIAPAHGETEWIIWAFGMSPKTRLPIARFVPWFTRRLAERDVRISILPPREPPADINIEAVLDRALERRELQEFPGKPTTPAQRAVALNVLKHVRRLDEAEQERVRLSLQRTFDLATKESDGWLSMRSEQAAQTRGDLDSTFAIGLTMQFQGVSWGRRQRKHQILRGSQSDRWLATPGLRVDVRFIREENDKPNRRERQARTILWTLKAIQVQLELLQKERQEKELFPPGVFL